MDIKFIPIDYDYFDYDGKNFVKIYGQDDRGKKVCAIDSCPVYLWAILKKGITEKLTKDLIEDIQKIEIDTKNRKEYVEKIEIFEKNFLGQKVKALKIYVKNYKDLQALAKKLNFPLIDKRRGYDLGYITHYIIEKKLNPLNPYLIKGKKISNEYDNIKDKLGVDLVFEIESIKEIEQKFSPKVLAFDIETDSLKPKEGEILMISLVGNNYKKVITWKKEKTNKDYVLFANNEKEMLLKFCEEVKNYSPDFLVGYNSDLFDLPFIKERSDILKIKLNFGFGSEIKFSRGITSAGKIQGITHIDLIKFIKTAYAQYMQSETLSLNEVAKEFLGESKKKFKFEHSSKLDGKWNDFYEYNLQDSILTYQLFEKFWPDLFEFSKIIKEPVFNISRNGLSRQIETYILHNLDKYNEIPERKPTPNEITERINRESVEGAFVYEPKPGIYENLAMFDFTSMHTSIIISHNISKETLTENKNNSYESPEIILDGKIKKFYFTKKPGFFPQILNELFSKRKKFKEEYKKNPNPITKARSNAFKVLTASAHGYIGFSGARYYSLESSSSILAFVRKYNKEIINKIEKMNHKVIYGDTDSVVFTCENDSKEDIKNLLKKLNDELPGVMHLELEGFFKRGIWVTTRHGETGAKKKYAMISDDGIIKIRGFETVRRDWCKLARTTQDKVIRLILEEGNEKKALDFVKEVIINLKERKIDKEDLLIKTQLKKPISDYKSVSPHVIAAMKLKDKKEPVSEGSLIEYYIAENTGKEKLVREKVKLPTENGKYDINYYLEKQIFPAVENIFNIFKINIKEYINKQKQENLKKWF